jgi:shikimate kinase
MPLVYITGAPGAGKSTIQQELSRRGYETYDLDDQLFGGAHNKTSGELVVVPPAEHRSPGWFDAHEWRVYPKAIESLKMKAQATCTVIFVCGVVASDSEILHLFDKVLYLALRDGALRNRIAARIAGDNTYGKNDFELQEIIARKHTLDKRYASSAAISIEAEGSLSAVVGDLLHITVK